jgi:carbon monoxide dehydrogenase subunit G
METKVMKKTVGIVAALAAFGPATALAGTPLNAYQHVYIKAPPAKVWQMIESFDQMQKWHPGVAKSEIVEGAPSEVGSVREVRYGDGVSVREELTRHDRAGMRIDYRLVGGSPWGLKEYTAVMDVVEPKPGTSALIWRSSFLPAAASSADSADRALMSLVEENYRAGLHNLKRMAERG